MTASHRLIPLALFVGTIGVLCLLQDRVSITDCDAEGYLMGARSLREGRGYVDTLGNHLNHWPPGYSLLLSLGPNEKAMAWIINLLSLGTATVLAQILAKRAGWNLVHSAALGAILGFGFFTHLAQPAKPDILCYAGFLLGMACYGAGTFQGRLMGCGLFALLIPLKLIAVTFAPGLLLAEWIHLGHRPFFTQRWRECLTGGCLWLIALGGVLVFNAITLQGTTPSSYVAPSLHALVTEITRFGHDFFRAGLASWYGSIRSLTVFVPYVTVMVLGLFCLASLRRINGHPLMFKMGATILVLSFGLEFYKIFYATPRLMGFGMLLMLLGLQPAARSERRWVIYAVAVLGLTIFNGVTVNRLGSNNAAYEAATVEASARLPANATVYSNAYRLLDVHSGRPTQLTTSLTTVPTGSWYWEVALPNYDAIAQPIGAPLAKDASWRLNATLANGALFLKE